jgi:hypothetical protein
MMFFSSHCVPFHASGEDMVAADLDVCRTSPTILGSAFAPVDTSVAFLETAFTILNALGRSCRRWLARRTSNGIR